MSQSSLKPKLSPLSIKCGAIFLGWFFSPWFRDLSLRNTTSKNETFIGLGSFPVTGCGDSGMVASYFHSEGLRLPVLGVEMGSEPWGW